MAENFLPLWIRDCLPQDIATKILTYCTQTNLPAKADEVCDCPAHTLLGAKAAKQQVAVITAHNRALVNQLAEYSIANAQATADLAAMGASLGAAFHDRDEAVRVAAIASDELLAAKAQARDFKQDAATFETKHGEAERLLAAASARVAAFESALKGLL